MKEFELYHHGILGMKWGVRRYQNKDGSLTLAGKKHFKMVNDNEQRKNEHTKIAKQLLKENYEESINNSKNFRLEYKETRDIDREYANNAKKIANDYMKKANTYNKLIKQIDSGKLIAGRDYITALDKKHHFTSVENGIVFKRNKYEVKDNKTYNKTGIKVSRDNQNRVIGLSASNATNRQIKKIHKMQKDINKKGDY